MTTEELLKLARSRGYVLESFSSDKSRYTLMKKAEDISLHLYVEEGIFELVHYRGMIKITTGNIGSFHIDVHFRTWEKNMLYIIRKLDN